MKKNVKVSIILFRFVLLIKQTVFEMVKKKRQKGVNAELLKRLKESLNALLDSKHISWGYIYKYDLKEVFDLPFGGHTAWKINKGISVRKSTIIKGLDFFNIDYVENYGLIDLEPEKTGTDETKI